MSMEHPDRSTTVSKVPSAGQRTSTTGSRCASATAFTNISRVRRCSRAVTVGTGLTATTTVFADEVTRELGRVY